MSIFWGGKFLPQLCLHCFGEAPFNWDLALKPCEGSKTTFVPNEYSRNSDLSDIDANPVIQLLDTPEITSSSAGDRLRYNFFIYFF